MMGKPILCLDFDGVIHSYTSGWKGASVIPDPPVPGALEFIVKAMWTHEVHILSSRSHQWGGKRAMKRWLIEHLEALGTQPELPAWWADYVDGYATHGAGSAMDPWYINARDAAKHLVNSCIKWPWFKPPATVTLDDRALTFTGAWPTLESIATFKPWNKR